MIPKWCEKADAQDVAARLREVCGRKIFQHHTAHTYA
jgi:hypothetical protein